MSQVQGPAEAAFGTLLQLHRLQLGWSQEELADRSGLSVRAIADMERGRTGRPHRHSVLSLADALRLSEPERLELDRASRVKGGNPAAGLAPPTGHLIPRELPAPVRHFTGRVAELAQLSSMAEAAGGRLVAICAIGGTAGVGKTALALQWAHEVADRFPDGQLYANLRGYAPGEPATAADTLAGFLRALGVPGADIPSDVDERAARYRSMLAGRRMLILADNASSAEQVRPLLPGASESVAVVTSRDSLPGLVARDGAQRLELDRLPDADAIEILRVLIGSRVEEDPAAAAVLASQCARLPLALRVAAERAAARPDVSLAELVRELADLERRMDLLDRSGDTQTDIQAVFSWSYRHLDADIAHAFGLLGQHPGPDYDDYATAALLGSTLKRARLTLDELARAHLIEPAAPGRYAMHDLLRAYSRRLARTANSADDLHAAMSRLIGYYVSAAVAARHAIAPAERQLRPDAHHAATPVPSIPDPAAGRRWMDAHRAVVVAVTAHAASNGWPDHATRLASAVFRYLERSGYHSEVLAVCNHARDAARLVGDPAAEAQALNNLTVVDLREGRYDQAVTNLRQSLSIYRRITDLAGQAQALGNIGIAALLQGRYRDAARSQRQALHLYGETGDVVGEARTLNNLGLVQLRLGRLAQAESCFTRSAECASQVGQRSTQAYAMSNLGAVSLQRGRYRETRELLQSSLDRFRALGDPFGECHALSKLGALCRCETSYQQAAEHYKHAIEISRNASDRAAEAEALNGLGEVLLAEGNPADGRIQHAAALSQSIHANDKYEQARAHDGLGNCHDALGDHCAAAEHWQHALSLYTQLGTPEVKILHDRLTRSSRLAPDRSTAPAF